MLLAGWAATGLAQEPATEPTIPPSAGTEVHPDADLPVPPDAEWISTSPRKKRTAPVELAPTPVPREPEGLVDAPRPTPVPTSVPTAIPEIQPIAPTPSSPDGPVWDPHRPEVFRAELEAYRATLEAVRRKGPRRGPIPPEYFRGMETYRAGLRRYREHFSRGGAPASASR